MTTMTLRMDDADAEVVRKYAAFEGVSISDFLRDAVFEKIEEPRTSQTFARPRRQTTGCASPSPTSNRSSGYELSRRILVRR